MPSRTKADTAAIERVHGETRSTRETARILGLHYNTVNQHLKRLRGICGRCSQPLKPGSSYCEGCLVYLRDKERSDRKKRQRQGVCELCDQPRDPLSRQYCAMHRVKHLEASARHSAKQFRATHGGIPTPKEQYRAFRYRYGQGAVNVWIKLDGHCAMCGVSHLERVVHVHHMDEDHANNAEENLTLLCQHCHTCLHRMMKLPAIAWEWMRQNYPQFPIA